MRRASIMFGAATVHYEDITPALLAEVRNNKVLSIEGEGCVIIPNAWLVRLFDTILDEVVENRAINRLKNLESSKNYTFDEVMSKLNLSDDDILGVGDIDE